LDNDHLDSPNTAKCNASNSHCTTQCYCQHQPTAGVGVFMADKDGIQAVSGANGSEGVKLSASPLPPTHRP